MLETRQMTVEDFLSIMAANAGVQPEYDSLSDEAKRGCAIVNIQLGTAQSFYEDGKLIGAFGVRFICLGEAWGLSIPEIRKDRKHFLFKEVKKAFEAVVLEKNLLRVFAVPTLSENFLEHLRFDSAEKVMVYNRKIE